MKNGVYYSGYWDEIQIICECCSLSSVPYLRAWPQTWEYIGEFWDESAELERYKKALELAKKQRNSYMCEEGRSAFIDVLTQSNIKKFDEEIDQILKGGGE